MELGHGAHRSQPSAERLPAGRAVPHSPAVPGPGVSVAPLPLRALSRNSPWRWGMPYLLPRFNAGESVWSQWGPYCPFCTRQPWHWPALARAGSAGHGQTQARAAVAMQPVLLWHGIPAGSGRVGPSRVQPCGAEQGLATAPRGRSHLGAPGRPWACSGSSRAASPRLPRLRPLWSVLPRGHGIPARFWDKVRSACSGSRNKLNMDMRVAFSVGQTVDNACTLRITEMNGKLFTCQKDRFRGYWTRNLTFGSLSSWTRAGCTFMVWYIIRKSNPLGEYLLYVVLRKTSV